MKPTKKQEKQMIVAAKLVFRILNRMDYSEATEFVTKDAGANGLKSLLALQREIGAWEFHRNLPDYDSDYSDCEGDRP